MKGITKAVGFFIRRKEHNIPILYYANRKHTEDLITDASEIISLLKNI